MDPIETMERDGVAKGEGEAQESEESTSHAAHLAAMWAGQSNVVVALRIRPVLKHDISRKSCVKALGSQVVIVMDPAANDKADVLRLNRSREKQYAFDFVFDANASQESVYNSTTKFLIHGVLDGYNATVFAYGQTGSGKTHTMIGSAQDGGIMVRVMEDLFEHSKQQAKALSVTFKVIVSFLEVYNETIRDLLSDAQDILDLREDPIKGPMVAGITEVHTKSGVEIMQLLHQGNARRSQAATAANEASSRSHAVLQIVVESQEKVPGLVANIKVGKLSLVDLAGSERAANTKNFGVRLVEGANINRSLLALGNCINALGEKGHKGNFIPYRDSKLTRLLKDSLGGNCRTVMIAAISSSESSFEETCNTLKYANRAKNIKSTVRRNVLNVDFHISEYVQLITNLRNEIQDLKDQLAPSLHAPPRSANSARLQPIAGRVMTPLNILSIPAPRSERNLPQQPQESSGTELQGLRDVVNRMRALIVENFQERMQLRRSLIELEDQNVQNSIEIGKREVILVMQKPSEKNVHDVGPYGDSDSHPNAFIECEQLKKAIIKNNNVRKKITKRLQANEKEADRVRQELLDESITPEDRKELMELQYQIGRLELENMELEQHRIVHESILKGKDLTIQKLKLEIALRDKIIDKQSDMLADLGYTDCSRWTSGSSNKPSMSSKAESSPLNSSSGRGVVAESCDIKFPLRCGSSKQTHSDLGAPSSTEDSESDPPNLLLPFRASPRTSRTPSKLGSRCAGLPLYEESDRRRCASKGEESRSLLTLSVQKLTPNNTEKSDLNGGDALENAVYISKFSPVISADPREEGVLDSRLRRELEQGDWSEVPQPSPSFILQASESMTHIAKSNTGMNFVEASMDAHKQREKKKVRKGLMSTFSVPIEIQGESVATTDIPRRPVGRKPRNDIDSSNLLNGTVVGDQRDSGFEVEPSMIQIHSFIGYVHPKKVVEGTQMLSATERVEDLDEVEGKKSKAVRGIQKTSNSSAMQPLLPKKSPRGRPLGQGGAFTAFSSQDTPDPLLSRGVQMPISKGFNKIS